MNKEQIKQELHDYICRHHKGDGELIQQMRQDVDATCIPKESASSYYNLYAQGLDHVGGPVNYIKSLLK